MAGRQIRLEKELWARIERVSNAGGYSSPEEFVQHVLEREVSRLDSSQSDEEIVLKLKGLGYID